MKGKNCNIGSEIMHSPWAVYLHTIQIIKTIFSVLKALEWVGYKMAYCGRKCDTQFDYNKGPPVINNDKVVDSDVGL